MNKMTNKKGIELSINFIVMLIIALVVFGMGLMLFKKFFVSAEGIKEDLDDQTRKELQAKMMSSPEQVVIYPTSLTIKKGRGDVIGVGVLNIGGDTTFTITPKFEKGYNRDGELIQGISCDPNNPDTCPIQVPAPLDRTVQLNKREIFSVPLRVNNNVASGKYSVSIKVEQTGKSAPISTNLVYVTIP